MEQVVDAATAAPLPHCHSSLQQNALCLECRYPLRGLLSSRCPECGNAFNPSDAATMYLGPRMGRLAQELLKPFGKTTNRLAVLATVLIVFAPLFIVPPVWQFLWGIGKLLWISVLARWLVRLVFRVATATVYRFPLPSLIGGWRRFIPVPGLFTAMTILVLNGWFVYPLLVINYPAMHYAATHASTIGNHENMRIGLFEVHDFYPNEFGVRFWFGPVGFVYRKSRIPSPYPHLIGPWYYNPQAPDPESSTYGQEYDLFSL